MEYSSDIKRSISGQGININSCGELWFHEDSHIRRYSGRNDYQLIYIRQGQCVVTVDGLTYIAYPGDCILYRPGEVQDYLLAKKTQPNTYWIHFNGDLCEKLFESLHLQNINIIKTGQNREIEHLISRVCQYFNLGISNLNWICSGLMQTILALLSNELHEERDRGAGNGKDKISEVISRMNLVPNLDLSVSKCADMCNMSKVHFARVFKQATGVPPVQFMLRIRIERAKELLDFTDESVGEIAEASGFRDQNYFARVFKQFTGMTPTQYRSMEKQK